VSSSCDSYPDLAEATGQYFEIVLRESFAIEVTDGETVGLVPLVLADPAVFAPRGAGAVIDFETFCELLAGVREAEMPIGELPYGAGVATDDETGLAPRRGAIPWRRILAAIHGVGVSLEQEAPFPRGVEFVLRNPTKLAGFLRRLEAEVDQGRFQQADHAYALHEVRRMLATASERQDHPESAALVDGATDQVAATYESLCSKAPADLAPQLRILESELAS
jgi:hypothetical protein